MGAPSKRLGKSRVAGVANHPLGFFTAVKIGPPSLANGLQKFNPKTNALPFRHHHQASCLGFVETGPGGNRATGHRSFVHKDHVASDRDHLGQPHQIMMRLKKRPESPVGLEYVVVAAGALPPLPEAYLPEAVSKTQSGPSQSIMS